jgi:adenosylmethionine---8-amino-7-oxononanoate aminotransferase
VLKPQGIFITGTDTGVGKTFVSALLCQILKKHKNIRYWKPVQTGYQEDDDTTTVVQRAQLTEAEWCAPSYRLLAPLSPDRAAQLENTVVDEKKILEDFNGLGDRFLILEGAGGLEVPLNQTTRLSALMKKINLPVVVVASTRLGTINHTLLTVQRAQSLGLQVLGVILNGPEDPGLEAVLRREGISILFSIPQLDGADGGAVDGTVDKLLQTVEKKILDSLHVLGTTDATHDIDRKHIWHPFTQHGFDNDFPVVVSGEGSLLKLANGEELVDGISSWWVNIHGHANPILAGALTRQANTLEHVIFSGYTHRPAAELTQRLVDKLQSVNPDLQRVFFSDNGSTAVEVALKMAYQFQIQSGQLARKKFLALRGSYHGDTLAAMSVSEREGFHQVFTPLMAPVDFVQPNNLQEIERLDFSQYAAVIFEPLVQGASGMKFHSAEYLQKLCAKAKAAGVMTVADEIFTGFYRTGSYFACQQAGVQPDVICLSKGITGGFLPLAVTIASEHIFSVFKTNDMSQAFLHGHSYTGNPLACAVAVASMDLLEKPEVVQQVQNLVRWTKDEIQALQTLPMVAGARALGTIGAFEIQKSGNYLQGGKFAKSFAKACETRGVLLRPLGGTVYCVPPYSTTQVQFQQIYRAIRDTLFDVERGLI